MAIQAAAQANKSHNMKPDVFYSIIMDIIIWSSAVTRYSCSGVTHDSKPE